MLELKRIGRLNGEIENLREKIKELSDALSRVTHTLDGMPKTENYSSILERLVASKVDLEDKLKKLEVEKEITQAEIAVTLALSDLTVDERKILLMRYSDCRPFKEIAKSMKYTERLIFLRHRSALDKLKKTAE